MDFFNAKNKIYWKLSNLWDNYRGLLALMDFKVSHIFREGNACADKLVSFGLNSRVVHLAAEAKMDGLLLARWLVLHQLLYLKSIIKIVLVYQTIGSQT
ncbi:hypothetical protein Lal_00010959, partial [Lupinus albus]